jgi:glycerol-3-phosphate dehydrogenase
VIVDHGRQGGPRGLFSVSGVKFTTARRVAGRTIKKLFPKSPDPSAVDHRLLDAAIRASLERSIGPANGDRADPGGQARLETLEQIMRSESVVHLHDLVFRRTNLWEDPNEALESSVLVGRKLGLEGDLLELEMSALKRLLEGEEDL